MEDKAIDVQICFWNLRDLLEFQAAFFTIKAKEPEHRIGMRRKIRQGLVHRHGQLGKFLEVLVVRRSFFRLPPRSEEHTSELQSRVDLVCRLLLEKKKKKTRQKQANITMHSNRSGRE